MVFSADFYSSSKPAPQKTIITAMQIMARERKRGCRRRSTCQRNSRRLCGRRGDGRPGPGGGHASPVPSRACPVRKRHGRVGRRARADRAGELDLRLRVSVSPGAEEPGPEPSGLLVLGTTVLRALRRTRSGIWLRCSVHDLVDTAEVAQFYCTAVMKGLRHGRDRQTVQVNRDITGFFYDLVEIHLFHV